MSELYNKIETLCGQKKINITKMCKEANVSRGSLTDLKKGRKNTLSIGTLEKIANYFGVSLDYFSDNDAKVSNLNITTLYHIPIDRQFREAARSLTLNLITESTYYIPVYESVSAGFGAYANDYIIDYTPLYIATPEEAQNTIVIVVSGDSMYPKIEDGDEIQVLRQDWAENGDIAVILIDDNDAVVKKYECDINREIVTLVSINPEYAPRVFKGKEIERLRVLGVVKKVIKEL